MNSEQQHFNKCLNCDAPVQEDFLYCAKCSQRLRTSKISVGSLLREFMASLFNFDSRFFQSFAKLIMPGTLTKEYISGRRKRYLNPARFFLFSMLFHFAVLAYISKDLEISNMGEDFNSASMNKNLAQLDLLNRYDSLTTTLPIDTSLVDTLRNQLFNKVQQGMEDSISLNNSGSLNFSFEDEEGSTKFAMDDILNMKEDEFLSHYKVEGFKSKVVTRQLIRSFRNPKGVFSFFIGNLLWAVILSLVFLSFIMKLLYIRAKRFFVEHLILLMHIHSFIFILVGTVLLATSLSGLKIDGWIWVAFGIGGVYFFISQYRYYGQGIIKTFFKFCLIMFAYLMIITIFAGIILLISMLFY